MNRDEIDNLAAEFCYVNNKGSRKRLVRTIYNVPNSRYEGSTRAPCWK